MAAGAYEEHTAVPVTGGLFSVQLGSIAEAINASVFNGGGDRYLQVWVCTTAGRAARRMMTWAACPSPAAPMPRRWPCRPRWNRMPHLHPADGHQHRHRRGVSGPVLATAGTVSGVFGRSDSHCRQRRLRLRFEHQRPERRCVWRKRQHRRPRRARPRFGYQRHDFRRLRAVQGHFRQRRFRLRLVLQRCDQRRGWRVSEQRRPRPLRLCVLSAGNDLRRLRQVRQHGGLRRPTAWRSRRQGTTYGVYGAVREHGGRGVARHGHAASGDTVGVYGESASIQGRGLMGLATATSGPAYGVEGRADSPDGRGVYG